ncbi:MAG: alpha/beta hydrolase domain-containing protein [Novosphingobium sp.]
MFRLLRHALCLVLIFAGSAAAARDARWIGPLVETDSSRIFAPVVLPGTPEDAAMRKAGYVQEEYLIEGDGFSWAENADGSVAKTSPPTGYVTRLVIVRPRDPARFNGVVQLGFNHPQFAHGNWQRIDALVLRSGMAYAMLMIGGDPGTRKASTEQWPVSSPLLFKWYDPARYAAFNWPSDDLRWDAIGQAAALLRGTGKGGPLKGLNVRRIYMSGWSYLGSIQRSFIEYGFHDRYRRKDGGPLIDGYLIGISAGAVSAGHVPLNTGGPGRDRRKDLLPVIDSPVIELTSEMEAITNVHAMRGESDAAKGGHRIYELGGTSHRDSGIDGQNDPSRLQLAARGHPGIELEPVCSVGYSDVPMRDVAQAALANMHGWVESGKAPPRAARMAAAPDGNDFVRDRFGNPVGGIRTAQLDVPLVRYGAAPASLCGGKEPRRKLSRLSLIDGMLAATYPGGKRAYLARFDARLAQLVKQGWLLAPDAAAQRQRARKFADEAFGATGKR